MQSFRIEYKTFLSSDLNPIGNKEDAYHLFVLEHTIWGSVYDI